MNKAQRINDLLSISSSINKDYRGSVTNSLLKKGGTPEAPHKQDRYTPDDVRKQRVDELKKSLDSLSVAQSGEMYYDDAQKDLLRGYQTLLEDFDNIGGYVQKELQAAGDYVAGKIAKPLVASYKKLKGTAAKEGYSEEDISKSKKEVSAELNKSAKLTIGRDFIKEGKYKLSISNKLSISKIASSEKQVDIWCREIDSNLNKFGSQWNNEYGTAYGELNYNSFNKCYELAIIHSVFVKAGHKKEAEEIDYIVKKAGWLGDAWEGTKKLVSSGVKAVGKMGKAVGKMVGKGLKYLGKALPGLGIIISLPMLVKNLWEAIQNGRKIMFQLPLNEYGFSKLKVVTPLGISHIRETYNKALEKYKASPKHLTKLLEIMRTISSFWIDFLFTVTNLIMTILDAIAIAGLFVPVVGWLASLASGGLSIILSMGLVSLELGAEYFNDKFWDKETDKIREVAQSEIQKILKEGKPQETESRFEIDMGEEAPLKPISKAPPAVTETPEEALPIAA